MHCNCSDDLLNSCSSEVVLLLIPDNIKLTLPGNNGSIISLGFLFGLIVCNNSAIIHPNDQISI